MNKNTIITIVLAVAVVLIIAGAALYFLFSGSEDDEEERSTNSRNERKITQKSISRNYTDNKNEKNKKEITKDKNDKRSEETKPKKGILNKEPTSRNTPKLKKRKRVVINENKNIEVNPLINLNSDTEEIYEEIPIMIPEKADIFKNEIQILETNDDIQSIIEEDYDEQFVNKLLTPPTQNTNSPPSNIIVDKNGDIMLYNPKTIHENIHLIKEKININTPSEKNNNKLIEYFPETTQHNELFSNIDVDVLDITMINDDILLVLLKDNKIFYQSTSGGNITETIFDSNNIQTQITDIFYFGDKLYAVGKNRQLYNTISTDFNKIKYFEWTPSEWCDLSVYWFSVTNDGNNLWIQSDIEGKMYKYIINKDPIQQGITETLDRVIRTYGENVNSWIEYDSRDGEGKDSLGKRYKNIYYAFYLDKTPQVITYDDHKSGDLIKGRYLKGRIFYIVK